MENIAAIILAAGRGVRMRSEKPKVFNEICGRPMLSFVLDAVLEAGVKAIYLVVGYKAEIIKDFYKKLPITFVLQEEQLGTAHAVMQARPHLKDFKGTLLVLAGDMPLIRPETIKKLISSHLKEKAKCSILSGILRNPGSFGRIVRNKAGEVEKIVEKKDAGENELKIKEVNTGTYCFDAEVFLPLLDEIGKENAQGEYYLTDSVALLKNKGMKVIAVSVEDPHEAIGVNTLEELKKAESLISERVK